MHIQIKILHLQLRFALTVLDTFCKLYLELCDGTSRRMDFLKSIVKNMIVMVLGL